LESIGSLLKRRREELGLTLEEIAQSTKINQKYLEAIEQDRFDILPANVYGKIFVASFARQLGVTQEELEPKLEVIEETAVWRIDHPGKKKHSKHLDYIFIGGGLFLGLIVLMVLILKPESQRTSDFEEASLKALQSLPLAPATADSQPLSSESSPPLLVLKIEAEELCSGLITSGTDTLFIGNLKKGQEYSWNSVAGFVVRIDRPQEAKLFINGFPLRNNVYQESIRQGLSIDNQNLKQLVDFQGKS
jgi:transcriptional regulator with XRE-family HTH domain